jgi:hypothetical protein
MVTELGTGLGMLGLGDIDAAVRSRPTVMHSLSPETWERLTALRAGGAYDAEFHAAWANGQAFLAARDGLRGRLPNLVEWKGTGRAPGDEVAPIDLRIDHVYLVSCKYLSDILFNVSPAHVFDYLLIAGQSRGSRAAREVLPGGGDWYAEVAPRHYQALYDAVRDAATREPPGRAPDGDGPDGREGSDGARSRGGAAGGRPRRGGAPLPATLPGFATTGPAGRAGGRGQGGGSGSTRAAAPDALRLLPTRAVELNTTQRDALGLWLRGGWPDGAKALYDALSAEVARASVRRWEAAMDVGGGTGEAMLWRLLRIGSAPYFVLGSSAGRFLRLRIATSWDWRQQYRLGAVFMEPQTGGQPRVGWQALVRDRVTDELHEVTGHIEVRWSHGRFGGLPEAKGYLDTPHHLVPGYLPLR